MLEDAYAPEASREDLADAVGQALDILGGEEEEQETLDDDEDSLDEEDTLD
jgi:hypothetical protein